MEIIFFQGRKKDPAESFSAGSHCCCFGKKAYFPATLAACWPAIRPETKVQDWAWPPQGL